MEAASSQSPIADPVFSGIDHAHMTRALRLAGRGLFTTQPNPRVGCVIARDEAVVGEGAHERAGEPHAEVFALRAAGANARGATAYVSLEPCAHFGKTPPCADALIEAGVARVVAACEDPNPRVAGGGFATLRTAGIVVETGLMRDAARDLNRGFFARIERGRPWVRVKVGMSLDGRTALATGASKWITGEPARADVQCWRARSSAIMTGIGTVIADDPGLTARLPDGVAFRPPLRVVLDSRSRAPSSARVFDGSTAAVVFHVHGNHPLQAPPGVEFVAAPAQDGHLDLNIVLAELAARGVNELQVEAGPTLCGALFAQDLVDEVLLYVAPIMLGDRARPLLVLPPIDDLDSARRMRVVDRRQIGDDQRLLLRW